MKGTQGSRILETWDQITFLLITRPVEEWEETFEEIILHEVERVAPHPEQAERPVADPSERGVKDGNQLKGHSACGYSIQD